MSASLYLTDVLHLYGCLFFFFSSGAFEGELGKEKERENGTLLPVSLTTQFSLKGAL